MTGPGGVEAARRRAEYRPDDVGASPRLSSLPTHNLQNNLLYDVAAVLTCPVRLDAVTRRICVRVRVIG